MFFLNVDYNEKDIVKGLGAKFDGNSKKWYVPDTIDLEPFKQWIPLEKMDEAEILIKMQQPDQGIKLSSLLVKIKRAIEENVSGSYWLNAEIANAQLHNGNLYLQLAEVDKNGKEVCTSRAIIWRDSLSVIENKFKQNTGTGLIKGLKVLLKVQVTYNIKHQMSLVVLDIDPNFTLGGMEAKIKKIRDQAIALGLYEKNKSFVMPDYFKRVAVVSPNEAAGLGDFRADADLLEKYGICNFTYYTATFQGDNTAKSVSNAIKKASFDSIQNKYDAIVVIRGGGAKTDLHFLNEFDIAKQVAESKVPVLVGVGHERDRILIDEMAFQSFDTPSKVIGFISNNNIKLGKNILKSNEDISMFSQKLYDKIKTSVSTNKEMIDTDSRKMISDYKSINKDSLNEISSLALKEKNRVKIKLDDVVNEIKFSSNNTKTTHKLKMEDILSEIKLLSSNNIKSLQSKIDLEYNNVINNANIKVNSFKSELDKTVSEIDVLSPLNALNNGFAIIKSVDGKILKTLEEINKENSFNIWMQDGEQNFKREE